MSGGIFFAQISNQGTGQMENEEEPETVDFKRSQTGWENMVNEGIWQKIF